ncbi:hypothetical protein BDY17DRAFT_320543 [Neohortaea acidophila]|uniref:CFEM domain-containing protein n=1 Tax=Neohortaea acidophila TaxID=245834 RepID=A0A6A6Q7W8_9PEZI|nr:uncharacterized protein BDY17DRAFT_320543 [Neohortaea acidophila]KAF2488036.1 hypothetical protein BDY17DRAFT_320543 [Neohortaea acidophila]
MKLLSTIPLLLAGIVRVHGQGFEDIPSCTIPCFTRAVADTSCSLFDFYCQCTSGAKEIQNVAIPCICHNSTCSKPEMMQLEKASNNLCSSALSASSQTYVGKTYPATICQALATGSSKTGSTASATESTATSSSATSKSAATPTNAAMPGAMLGMAGLAMLAL